MNEAKMYRIRFFTTWPAVCLLMGITIMPWVLYSMGQFVFNTHNWSLRVCWFLLALALAAFFVVVIISSMMTVTVTTEGLIITRPDITVHIEWRDIKRIESSWAIFGGNFVYQIITTEGRRLPFIPDYIESCQELLTALQARSGKRIVSETRTIGVSIKEDWKKLVGWFRPTKSKH